MVVHYLNIVFTLVYHQYFCIDITVPCFVSQISFFSWNSYNHKLGLQNFTGFKGQYANELIRSMQITIALSVTNLTPFTFFLN